MSGFWAHAELRTATADRITAMKSALLLMLAGLASQSLSQSLDNLFETALGTAGTTTQDIRFDSDILPFFYQPRFDSLAARQIMNNPWRTPLLVRNYRDELGVSFGRPSETMAIGARMMGTGLRRSLLGNPIATAQEFANKRGSLTSVLNTMKDKGLLQGTPPSLNSVPDPVKEAAALILMVAMDSAAMRRAAFTKVGNMDRLFDRFRTQNLEDTNPEELSRMFAEQDRIDMQFLAVGAQDLAMAVTAAKDRLLGVGPDEKFEWRCKTVWGDVVLGGGTSNEYDGTFLLVIDTGGNDQYIGVPANRTPVNWVSIVLDSAGNDRYTSNRALAMTPINKVANRKQLGGFGPAQATTGYAYLFDLRGDDVYRTTVPGIASAGAGAAIISDADGSDLYDGYSNSVAAATFGYATLEDIGGNDRYQSFSQSQGFGGVNGFASLADLLGNDTYASNNTEIDFPSPQTAQSNVSMSQGAGMGRRADYSDGHSQSGGIGVLFDVEGDDKYSCGVFGQGVGYWGGVGMLFDRAGKDTYFGDWYVQGAAAHFAIGYLEDEGDSDSYSAKLNMAQGAGHDFSLGYLIDRNGNDVYKAPNLSLGAGNANGMGMLLDFDGDDQYESSGLTLGRAAEAPKASLRERCVCFGLFYDGGGKDTYPASTTWAKESSRVTNWTDRGYTAKESQFGIFWDR